MSTDDTTTTADTTGDTDAQGDATSTTTDDGKDAGTVDQGELATLRAKLKKANAEAAAHRRQADELRKKGETEAEAAVRAAKEEAEKGVTATWKPRLVRMAARTALVEAGLVGKPDRLLRLIDADRVDIDDDGEVTGIDDQIRDLKKDYPDMFGKRGASRIDGADRESGHQAGDATSKRLLQTLMQ